MKTLITLASCMALSVVAFMLWRVAPDSGTYVPTIEVNEELFVRVVTAEGNMKAAKATPLSLSRQGRRMMKLAWLAEDGSAVTEQQVVARLDPSELEQSLEQAVAQAASADAKIASERIGVGTAKRDRKRAANMARRELEQSDEFVATDTEVFSRHQIAEGQIDGVLLSAKVAHADRAGSIESRVSGSKLKLLRIEREKAQQEIDRITKALGDLVIRAPHAGLFVLKRNRRGEIPRVGDQLWPGQLFAELPLVDDMQALVHVLEADAGGLEVGQKVALTIEAHPDRTYAAKVAKVATLPASLQKDVPTQYFEVTLSFEATDTVMKPGQRVRAELTLESRNAVVVPRQAVFEVGTHMVVYKRIGEGYEAVEVTLGSSTAGRVVVETGLTSGSRVALQDPTARVNLETKASAKSSAPATGTSQP